MKEIRVPLSNDELQDIWSAITVWQKHLDKKENPRTNRALNKLVKKIRQHIKSIGVQ